MKDIFLVSPEFRHSLLKELPVLENSSFMWLFGHLAFGTFEDFATGRLLLPADRISKITGERNIEKLLEEFKANVFHFEYKDYSSDHNKARTVTSIQFPKKIELLVAMERDSMFGDKPVDLISGLPYTSKDADRFFDTTRLESMEYLTLAKNQTAKTLLSHLNNLPRPIFKRLLKNYEKAYLLAKSLPNSRREMKILRQIYAQCVPHYKSTENSSRLFPLHTSILTLDRRVRKALCSDWIELDLKSAQLAINAKIWGMPEVEGFLRTNKSFWVDLAEFLMIELEGGKVPPANKDLLKHLTYAVCYGGTIWALRDELKKYNRETGEELGDDFLIKFRKHFLIKKLLKARTKMLSQIRKDGGMTDAYGKWICTKKGSRLNDKSVLAQVSQSYELRLLDGVVKDAVSSLDERYGWVLALWQHDGFSALVKYESKVDTVVKRLQWLVRAEARKLGIITELEVNK